MEFFRYVVRYPLGIFTGLDLWGKIGTSPNFEPSTVPRKLTRQSLGSAWPEEAIALLCPHASHTRTAKRPVCFKCSPKRYGEKHGIRRYIYADVSTTLLAAEYRLGEARSRFSDFSKGFHPLNERNAFSTKSTSYFYFDTEKQDSIPFCFFLFIFVFLKIFGPVPGRTR